MEAMKKRVILTFCETADQSLFKSVFVLLQIDNTWFIYVVVFIQTCLHLGLRRRKGGECFGTSSIWSHQMNINERADSLNYRVFYVAACCFCKKLAHLSRQLFFDHAKFSVDFKGQTSNQGQRHHLASMLHLIVNSLGSKSILI